MGALDPSISKARLDSIIKELNNTDTDRYGRVYTQADLNGSHIFFCGQYGDPEDADMTLEVNSFEFK